MRQPAAVLISLAIAGSACTNDPPTGPCTADLRPGIVVTIRDAATGEPVAGQAIGQVEDHRYVDSLRAYGYEGTPSVLASRAAAFERSGTYEVTVFAADYQPWILQDVEVLESPDSCHVVTVELEANLQLRD